MLKYTNRDEAAIKVGVYIEEDSMFGDMGACFDVATNDVDEVSIAKLTPEGTLKLERYRASSEQAKILERMGLQLEREMMEVRDWASEEHEEVWIEDEFVWVKVEWEGFEDAEG